MELFRVASPEGLIMETCLPVTGEQPNETISGHWEMVQNSQKQTKD